MKDAPSVPVDEFLHYTVSQTEVNGFNISERVHPEFGYWRERNLDLGHIRIFENVASLKRNVNVHFVDEGLREHVHHCISLEGKLGTHFNQQNVRAALNPKTFHQIFLPSDHYHLTMEAQFTNVHIAINRDHYISLLPDSEKWSSEMKEKLLSSQVLYTGEFNLSPQMMHIIYAIFDSPISGSLKKLLIEAKVHELIAEQLHNSVRHSVTKAIGHSRDLFVAIQQYLDDTFLNDHSLKGIARHFGINEFTLKKGYREYFDTTVFDYLLTKRLQYSYELLQGSAKTIEQIGSEVGYKYPNHFSTAFKKKFGVRPTQVR